MKEENSLHQPGIDFGENGKIIMNYINWFMYV